MKKKKEPASKMEAGSWFGEKGLLDGVGHVDGYR